MTANKTVIFSVGDIVRVARQPNGLVSKIVGEVGFIEETNDTHAQFNGLKLDGSFSGCGAVPFDCLELETGAQWKQAKVTRDTNSARTLAEGLGRGARINAGIAVVAAKHGLSVDVVETIYQEMRDAREC